MSGQILIGTASWTDKSLVESGKFYPKGATTAEARLRFYAENFPIVEVDSTYYFPPTEKNSILWAERTPVDFTFHVKAYSLLTQHPTRPSSLYKDLHEEILPQYANKKWLYINHLGPKAVDEAWERFASALLPLHSTGKLGVVHFQFPEWFIVGSQNREYIEECVARLADYQIAVEFRNKTWLNEKNAERTVDFLSKNSIPLSCVDMPQGFRSSVPPIAVATHPTIAYVRFHGRNTEEWEKPHETATPRFAYKYTSQELAEWVPKLQALSENVSQTHVLMNNCYQDYAVTNGKQLASLLGAG